MSHSTPLRAYGIEGSRSNRECIRLKIGKLDRISTPGSAARSRQGGGRAHLGGHRIPALIIARTEPQGILVYPHQHVLGGLPALPAKCLAIDVALGMVMRPAVGLCQHLEL